MVKDVQLPSFAPAVPSVTLKWSFAKAYEGAAIDGNNMLRVYPSEWENRGTVDLVATACAADGTVLSTRSFNIGVPYLSEPFCASEEDLLYSENFDGKTDASQVNGKLTYVTQRTDGSNNISLENGRLKLVRPDSGGSYDAVRLFFNQDEKGFPGRVALEYEITREQASEVLLSADTTGSGNYVASGRWSFNTDGSDFAKAYVGQSTTNWNMNQTNLNAAFRGLGPFKVVQCFDTEERTWSLWVNGIRLLDNKLASQAGSAPVISNLYMVLQYANLNTIYVDNVKVYKPTPPAKDATELQNRDNVKLEISNMTQEVLVAETIDDEAVMRFGYIPINSGCTVSFTDEKGLVNPDGTIRMPDQGTADKVTAKVTCGSYSQSVTYTYWIAGKLEIGDYIYGDSNVVNGKNTVSIQASTRDGSDKNVVLSLAIYDADGRLKAVSYDKRSITAKSDDNILSTEVTIEKDENELYTRKTFLWAEETLSPIYKAEPTLQMPAYFTDNMVLQRRENVHIWGKAPAGAEVQVTYAAQNKTAITNSNGDWSLYLDPMEAIWEGEELVIRTVDNVKRIQNVVVGEVWMVTGQSNAELTMSQYSGTANDIATANNRMIRYMKATYTDLYATTSEKRDEYSVLMAIDWAEMTPALAAETGCTAYYYAKALQSALGVPVGIINNAKAGKAIQEFMPEGSFNTDTGTIYTTGAVYNELLMPFFDYTFKGIVWYQGEQDYWNKNYGAMFKYMVEDYRAKFNNPDMPVLFVQMQRFERDNGDGTVQSYEWIRECMRQIEENVPNTYMANNMESNDPVTSRDQNHPTNKRALGENLTRLAQNKLYGRTDVIPTGPMLDSYIINESKALVKFKYAGSGLVLRNVSALYGFEIAGADGVFHTADAVITGSDTVEVTCNDVSQPIYVRFMHEAFPHPLTLYNSEGLVASPFAPDLPINFNLTR